MPTLTKDQIQKSLSAMRGKNIVVIGDFMLDRYIWGNVQRISPEAPVPVVEVREDAQRPGGAGNVVLNLASLGAKCTPVGLIGGDDNGRVLRELLQDYGADADGLVIADDRPTTVKTRIIAGNQQLLRVDREQILPGNKDAQNRLTDKMRSAINGADAVILQDYNKGVLTTTLIREAISTANEHDVPVGVDPKAANFFEYRDATLFKPNRREAEGALNRTLENDRDAETAGEILSERLRSKLVLLTRGSQGMSLFEKGQAPIHIDTRPQRISDVSGAGDTVISTMMLALVSGMDAESAARLATRAAEYVVGAVGVVPITPAALLSSVD